MNRKSTSQIKTYYQLSQVASGYDDRRFSGKGGEYINNEEVNSVASIMKLNLSVNSPAVLDLGAGRGRLSIPLKKTGFHVSCLDSSNEMLSFLRKEFPANRIIIQSVFDRISTKSKYSAITSLRFFDHFDIKSQKKILKNTTNLLSKEGLYFYATLNKSSLEYLVSSLFPYGRYNYYYTEGDYQHLFKSTGLKIVDSTGAFFIPRGVFLHTNSFPWLQKILITFDQFIITLFPQFGALRVFVLARD